MGPRPDGRGKGSARTAATCGFRRQWGRGQTAAESRHSVSPVDAAAASMGPRPDGRGKFSTLWACPLSSVRVNGAAARRPRKGRRAARASLRRLLRQWGRGQTAAERRPKHRPDWRGHSVNGAAARRPRKVECRCHFCGRKFASMGPRPDGRGKLQRSIDRASTWLRQWGRGQTAAESW